MIEIELVMAATAQDTITIEASHMSKVNPSKNKLKRAIRNLLCLHDHCRQQTCYQVLKHLCRAGNLSQLPSPKLKLLI